ncbi:hypothetical protein SH580_18840 [Coraliomargarita algicola]|uniref:PEP-CTERM protein-sorting domain-containing protein n=1 Tax=Coraliomargarita algicola TaxID=3092156 RepID=A0ABZ0RRB7_9BACT|nr:hypothetical protein [Coraliomargarita sp. J2-16]WPJ95479.1 hypothetical protein SH580_18840 [Coraliomargarita sp. J2-16]
MIHKKYSLIGLAFLAATLNSQAATLVGWDFGTPDAEAANSVNPAPTTIASGLSITSALDGVGGWNGSATQYTIGDNTGVAASGTTFGSTEAGNFGTTTNNANGGNLGAAITGNDYISFAITADTAGALDITGFSVSGAIASSKAANKWNILAQVDGGSTWEVAGALTTDQTITATQGLTDFTDIFIDLSGNATFQGIDSVEFRIYSWGGNGTTSSSRAQIDNLLVEGVIPEPSTYALLAGCFALSSVMLRRRRA